MTSKDLADLASNAVRNEQGKKSRATILRTMLASIERAPEVNINTTLQLGDVIQLIYTPHVVWFVNDCRAAAIPFLGGGSADVFKSRNISPNSECAVEKKFGKKGLISILAQDDTSSIRLNINEKENNMGKKAKTEDTETAPKLGRLGGYDGHSVTSVIRAMAMIGWNTATIRATLVKLKLHAAEPTIGAQACAGRKEGATGADISKKQLESVKVEKPAKTLKVKKVPKAKRDEQDDNPDDEEEKPRVKAGKTEDDDEGSESDD